MRAFVTASLACAASLAAVPALGQAPGDDRQFYVGADLGLSRMDQPDIVGVANSSDEDAFSWSLRFGYRFNRFFSLEGGYADLGDFDYEFRGACTMQFPSTCGSTGDTRTSVDGFLVNAVGTVPIGRRFLLTGSVGALYREVEYSAPASSIGPHFSSTEGTAWRVGIGAAFPLNERLEIGLDLVHYMDVGVAFDMSSGNLHTVDDGDATSVTLGLRLWF